MTTDHISFINIAVVGAQNVGKSFLVSKMCRQTHPKREPTIGIDFQVRMEGKYKLRFFDISGNERYRELVPSFLQSDLHMMFFCYRQYNVDDLVYLHELYKEYIEQKPYKPFIYLLCLPNFEEMVELGDYYSYLKWASNELYAPIFYIHYIDKSLENIVRHVIEECYPTDLQSSKPWCCC